MRNQAERVGQRPEVTNRRGMDKTSAALLATAVAVLVPLFAIPQIYNLTNDHAKPTPTEAPTPTPPPTRVVYNGQNAPEILIASLKKPESALLSSMNDAYYQDGLLLKDWSSCLTDKNKPNRTFSSGATKREAPFKESREIRAIEAGEPFHAAIEVVVAETMKRKDISETWMGQIEAGGITWAVKEQRYRDHILKEFAFDKEKASCTPFDLPFDYREGFRGPIQKVK